MTCRQQIERSKWEDAFGRARKLRKAAIFQSTNRERERERENPYDVRRFHHIPDVFELQVTVVKEARNFFLDTGGSGPLGKAFGRARKVHLSGLPVCACKAAKAHVATLLASSYVRRSILCENLLNVPQAGRTSDGPPSVLIPAAFGPPRGRGRDMLVPAAFGPPRGRGRDMK